MYIEANGKIYTFYDHALDRMAIRDIEFAWVESALIEPDDVILISPIRTGYDKEIEDGVTIRVVVDEEASLIVTVFYREEN